jgi:hypothetical protein
LMVLPLIVLSLTTCKDGLDLERKNLYNTGYPAEIKDISAVITGNIIDLVENQNIRQYGHCWDINANPDIEDPKTELGANPAKTSFSSELVDLEPETEYFVRMYLTINDQTVYGNQISFRTSRDTNLPTIHNIAVNNIADITANAEGQIPSLGIYTLTAYGHCWSLSPEPTVGNSKTTLTTPLSGENKFNSNLTGLQKGKKYYVRSYVQTSTPQATVFYGNEISFITLN